MYKDMRRIYQDLSPHSSLKQSYNVYFDLISEITYSTSLNTPCSLSVFNFISIPFSVISVYGFDFICLFFTKGNPFVVTTYVKNILIAVVVSTPKSLNRVSHLPFNASPFLTWIVLAMFSTSLSSIFYYTARSFLDSIHLYCFCKIWKLLYYCYSLTIICIFRFSFFIRSITTVPNYHKCKNPFHFLFKALILLHFYSSAVVDK